MQIQHIPLHKTGQMHALTQDYLLQKPEIQNLYKWPLNFEGIEKAISERKNYKVDRQLLVKILQDQYKNLNLESAENKSVADNINSLLNENTFTITTGHQLNIFTGPLYFIYKIASAIKYSQQLKAKFPANNFVPVYWMASEDHDFEEINHIYLWGKMLQWNDNSKGAVGRISPKTLEPIITQLQENLGTRNNAEDLISLFKEAYLKHETLSESTRYIAHSLFREYGLIVLDADDTELKKQFIPVFEKDIFENIPYKEVSKNASELQKKYKLPVTPREINVFYLTENNRSRIVKESEIFKVLDSDKSWTETELRAEIYSNPERFSPNVVLRPMYQETILPNLAYIGGTNEIAYWFELKNAFDACNVFFPQLVVRDSALFIGKGAMKNITQCKLEPQDFLLNFNDLKAKYYDCNEAIHPAENTLDELQKQYELLRNEIQNLPSATVAPIVKSMNEQLKELKKWRAEIKKYIEQSEEKGLEKLEKTYQSLFPNGTFQERKDNFMSFYVNYGKDFIPKLIDAFDPVSGQLHLFIEE